MNEENTLNYECTCGKDLKLKYIPFYFNEEKNNFSEIILKGNINSVICDKCNKKIVHKKPFMWIDIESQYLIECKMQGLSESTSFNYLSKSRELENLIEGQANKSFKDYSIISVPTLEVLQWMIRAIEEKFDPIFLLSFCHYLKEKFYCLKCRNKKVLFYNVEINKELQLIKTTNWCPNCLLPTRFKDIPFRIYYKFIKEQEY